ncbi:MAG: DUF4870 domain-containing protein [Anaerolineaceae bacterium]|nr:DUF4870 domain-containing protein [Anaerolineaceae bacterium]
MTGEPENQDSERLSRLIGVGEDPDADTVVEAYETRYERPPKRKAKPRSYSTLNVTNEERLWAAVAHASVWLTVLGGLFTTGFIVPVSVFIPLVIYLMYRKQSDYVAFHALQAFALQLLGTVGAFALLIVGGIAWGIGMVIALLLIVVLAGIILVPLWGLVGIVLLLAVFLMPLAALLLGTMAAVETYNGRDYRYPVISHWIDRQLAGEFLRPV